MKIKKIFKESPHLFNNSSHQNQKKKDSLQKKKFLIIIDFLKKNDPILKTVIEKIGLFWIPSDRNSFEFFIDAIIAQQLSLKAAKTISKRLRFLFQSNNQTASPKTFLMTKKEDFLSIGFSHQKYHALRELSDFLINNHMTFSDFQDKTDKKIREILTSIKGIGNWTVDMYLIFGLKRLDIFPIKDLVLNKFIDHLYNIDRNDSKNIQKISMRWKPYRSIASWYLYQFSHQNNHL